MLSLTLEAVDATGRYWIDKTYTNNAVESVSLNQPLLGTDPFLYLYSDIHNDLLSAYRSLTPEQVLEIKEIATLRYAAALSPDAFADYLEEVENLIQLTRLPAAIMTPCSFELPRYENMNMSLLMSSTSSTRISLSQSNPSMIYGESTGEISSPVNPQKYNAKLNRVMTCAAAAISR